MLLRYDMINANISEVVICAFKTYKWFLLSFCIQNLHAISCIQIIL